MGIEARIGRLRLFAALLCATAVIALSASPVQAKYASLVMDAETGRVLHQVNADTRNYPASLAKMMTLYLVFEALNEGRLALDHHLEVTARAARQPAARLGLKRGQTITVEQAILALVTKSANDASVVIAQSLKGSQRDFALVMTAKARQLGMRRTTFRNPSGLLHRGQLSTARDMAVLARRLLKDFPEFYHYFSTRSFVYGGIEHKNHNDLLKTYQGTDGIKTGYISASGFNLVASVKRGGHRLIGVLFGGRSARTRNRQMVKLLDKGFRLIDGNVQAERAPKASAKKRLSLVGSPSQWAIQVGAYKQYTPAFELASNVIEKFPDLLEGGYAKVFPLQKGKRRPLYRARILGISKTQAYRACRTLKRRRMDCLEVRLKGVQLASAG